MIGGYRHDDEVRRQYRWRYAALAGAACTASSLLVGLILGRELVGLIVGALGGGLTYFSLSILQVRERLDKKPPYVPPRYPDDPR